MEKVPEHLWNTPLFMMINYHVTYIWALEFLLSMILDLLGIFVYPNNVPARFIPSLIILFGALVFTNKYPDYARAHSTQQHQQQQSDSEEQQPQQELQEHSQL
jgi:hypothetical protein